VVGRGEKILRLMNWGLVPAWTKELKTAPRPINARAETALELATFRKGCQKGRVLIVADGFVEWLGQKGKKGRTPILFRRRDREPFAFAGISDLWTGPTGNEIATFAILTVPPNDLVGRVHDRMPAILARKFEEKWLDPETFGKEALSFARPSPSEELDAFEVSREINSPQSDHAGLIVPLASLL
jgi:putative SOS response-associated peptidase YedK